MKTNERITIRTIPKPTRTLQPDRNEIAHRAYEIWQRSGQPQGHDMDHWLTAESQLREEHRTHRMTG